MGAGYQPGRVRGPRLSGSLIECILERVLAPALAEEAITLEDFVAIANAVLPESFVDAGLAAEPTVSPVLLHTAAHMAVLEGRAARGEQICHPDDEQPPDSVGILLTFDHDRPSGTLAPKRLAGEFVPYTHVPMTGDGRAELPECSDRLIRDGGEAREARRCRIRNRFADMRSMTE